MKRYLLLLILSLALPVWAQQAYSGTPAPIGVYTAPSGNIAGPWYPFAGLATAQAYSGTPAPAGLYASPSGNIAGPWYPWSGNAGSSAKASGSPFTTPAVTGFYWNDTASAYSFALPTPSAGLQLCFGNYKARTSAISLIPGTGVTIYFKGAAGTAGSVTGLSSSGAAGDFICLVGTDATTYMAIGAGYGTFTNH